MKTIKLLARMLPAIVLLILPILGSNSAMAAPASYNDPNFKLVWERTDKPVNDGVAARSWMWGPATVPGSPASEPYTEAPGSFRTVQYFDKSRMEVNDPNGDRSQLWFVTNGLLVREMVAGQIQLGDDNFSARLSSAEAVAGDPASDNPNAPTYATFKNIASLNNDHPANPRPVGSVVNDYINKLGQITGAVPDPSVRYFYYDTNLKHNIPNVFWDFMNQKGPIYWMGSYRNDDTVINWVFAMGLPITEPYWTTVKVGGVDKDVLVQLFERRVLTYTPSNAPGWKVEMGNVGQHYKRWRYDTTPLPPPPPPPAQDKIAFVSDRSGTSQIWTMNTDGTGLKMLTTQGKNEWPRWSPDNSRIAFQSNRDGNWEIYIMDADGSNQIRLTYRPDTVDVGPQWSPDGKWIMFNHSMDIWLIDPDNNNPPYAVDDIGLLEATPIWAPDSLHIAYAYYLAGNQSDIFSATYEGVEIKRLTTLPSTDDMPSDWIGNKILFISSSGNTCRLGTMNEDGSSQQFSAEIPKALSARWSPDTSKVVFDGGGEIWVADHVQMKNITNNAGYDGQPDWSN